MTLKQWVENGWLKAHQTDAKEIGNLLAIVDRDLHDAITGDISADWRLVLPTMLLSSSARSCFTLKAIRLNGLYSITAPFKPCRLFLDQKESKTRSTWKPVGSKGMLSNMIM